MAYVATLFGMEDIAVLLQYLYMDESNFVTVGNDVTKFEIRMKSDCSFWAKNLSFPDLPDLCYGNSMTVANMLGIIIRLKEEPPQAYKRFSSRWEEIKNITLAVVARNKMEQKRLL